MNMCSLVGRLVSIPELKKDDRGKEYSYITLAVNRSYKNDEGIYETDFIEVKLENSVAKNTCEYCRKGDLIGIKGRLENRYEEENELTRRITYVVAERVSFLATNKTETKESE